MDCSGCQAGFGCWFAAPCPASGFVTRYNSGMDNLDQYRLGETDELLRVNRREECRELALALARQASSRLCIFSNELDAALYNSRQFVEAARDIIGSAENSHGEIRILVHDVSKPVSRGHQLLDLSRRLSSRVQLRKMPQPIHHAFLIADHLGVLDQRRAERYEATASFNQPGWARDLQNYFDQVWQRSITSFESHSLSI